MTPLAMEITKQTTLRLSERTFRDEAGILPLLYEAHFFECSALLSLRNDLIRLWHQDPTSITDAIPLMFLPAPITWIEMNAPNRKAFLIRQAQDKTSERYFLTDIVDQSGSLRCTEKNMKEFTDSDAETIDLQCMAYLTMINSPRVFGRKTHLPHAGFQRKLAHSKGLIGKFPLRAWTEITLEVGPPKFDKSAPHETRLTGDKCLHFVRTFRRFRRGKWELVHSHWRGNPALGMKQSRYRVIPARGINP